MTATIYIMNGCEFCIQLKANLTQAGIPFNVTYDPICGAVPTPATSLNGTCYTYSNGYDINAQYNKIAEDYSPPTVSPTPTTTPSPPAATAPAAATPNPTVWAGEELTVKWGGISGTAGKTYTDETRDATDPVPPDEPVGLTIALRSHKKAPTGRKIA